MPDAPETPDVPAGTKMSYWIAHVLQQARERAGVSEGDIGTSLGVNWRTIRRLEAGTTMGRDIDHYVAGYAHLLGLEDGRALWREALRYWDKDGAPPRFMPVEGPAAAFAEAIRLEALRTRQETGEKSSKRRASR